MSVKWVWVFLTIFIWINPFIFCHILTVATYNLWNVMFNWDVRKYRISQMIKEVAPDVIAFQEVRQNTENGNSQLQDIQTLIPWLKYEAFTVIQKVNHKSDAYHREWAYEGLGLLSQYPIAIDVQNLTHSSGQDKNHRAILHCTVKHPLAGDILVSIVHLSYDKQQQCRNVMELIDYLKYSKVPNKIVLGDFNAYASFPWSVKLFLNPRDKEALQKCSISDRIPRSIEPVIDNLDQFVDVWTEANPSKPGRTFSNMPVPGLESRPDRQYVTKNMSVLSARLWGDGSVYKSKFFLHIFWKRVSTTLSVMHDARRGLSGRACVHDCGPHASCRCGICVSGGDSNMCNNPNCPECDQVTLNQLTIFLAVAVILVIHLLYGIIQVLQTMNNRSHRSCMNVPLCDWFCLCDVVFYSHSTESSRSHPIRSRHLTKYCPLFRLPPMLLVLVTVFLICVYVQIFMTIFHGLLQDIYAIIPEEMFPSDHLMLSATFEVKDRHS